jgi:hypothetical protein
MNTELLFEHGKDPYYYTNTKIYKYHKLQPELCALEKIITENAIIFYTLDNFLYNCYTKIIDNGLEHIIYDIMLEPNNDDAIAICKMAIDKNKLYLIDFLIEKKIDLNRLTYMDQHIYVNMDILTHAVRKNDMSIVKYLVEYGANPFENGYAFKESYISVSDDIFDFFIGLDMSYQSLCSAFVHCCHINGYSPNKIKHNSNKLKKIINKGININDIYMKIPIANFPMDMIIFLIDHGFNINSTNILVDACMLSNYELLDFLLQQGLQMNAECLKIIFTTMNMNMINTLIKHNVNLSILEPVQDHCDILNKLEALGLEKNVLFGYLMNRMNTYKKLYQ